MRILKLIIIVLSFLVFLVLAFVVQIAVTFIRPSSRWHTINRLTCGLIKFLRNVLGIRVNLEGHPEYLNEQGNFLISRHIGYIDGIILGALTPLTFISKKEIGDWPLIGKVVQISGTIFVDRQNRSRICHCLRKMAGRLKDQINLLIFPEGTSTDGSKVLPFQAPFFSVPIMTRSAIVPITIEYHRLDGKTIAPENRDEICWYNHMKFAPHLWNLLRFRRIDVRVVVHEKISTETYRNTSEDRKKLAQRCHQALVNFVKEHSTAFNSDPFAALDAA